MSSRRAAPSVLAPGLCLALALVACGSAPVEEFDLAGVKPDGGGRCTPGDTQSCICLGGGQGTQTCRASGASFGPCTACTTGMSDGGTVVIDRDMGGSACGDCDGCCDGAACVPFANQTDAKCGPRGVSCTNCTTQSKVCGAGTGMCVTAGGCGSCANGCCQNNICYQNQAAKCGSACTQCTYGVTCVGGACTTQIDRNAYFKIYVKKIRLKYYDYVSDPSGGDYWDGAFDDDPENQGKFYYQLGGTIYEGASDYIGATDNSAQMTRDVTFDATTGLVKAGGNPFLVPGSVLADGLLHAVAQDNDSGVNLTGDDVASDSIVPASATLMMSYSMPAKDSMVEFVFELK